MGTENETFDPDAVETSRDDGTTRADGIDRDDEKGGAK